MFEEQAPEQKKYYPFLDGFRGLAILWVILHHADYLFSWNHLTSSLRFAVLDRIGNVGIFGVDIFFVISGFLITGLLLDDLNQKIRLKRFYLRRFFKIAPQYYVVLIVGIILTNMHFITRLEFGQPLRLISHFFIFQNYVSCFTTLAHTWSLAIEEHFYFFYPLILQCICLTTPKIENRHKLIFGIGIVLILAINLLRYFSHGPDFISHHLKINAYFQTTHFRSDGLILGCLLKIAEPYYKNGPRLLWKNISRLFFVTGIVIYLLFIMYGYDPQAWYNYTLIDLAAGMLILAAYNGYDLLMKPRWLIWIGKNSYGIYLWHYMLFYPYLSFLGNKQFSEGTLLLVSFSFILMSIMAGALSTITIERYFLNLRKKLMP